jgi:probable phosphoglycerate mutase
VAPRGIDLGNPFIGSLDGMCELLLVRHGEQRFEPDRSLGHNIDAPLSDLGRRQAAAVGERLADVEITAVYSSPMQRAFDTGSVIAGHHGLEIEQRPELAEINLWLALDPDKTLVDNIGEDELRSIYREAGETRSWESYPYSEDPAAFRDRVRSTIDSILGAHEGERVAVTCHGGVINGWLSGFFGSPRDNVVSIHHTSITTIRRAGARQAVIAVNDYAHVMSFQNALDPLNVA